LTHETLTVVPPSELNVRVLCI